MELSGFIPIGTGPVPPEAGTAPEARGLLRERMAAITQITAETTRNKKGILAKEAANIPRMKLTASQANGALILSFFQV